MSTTMGRVLDYELLFIWIWCSKTWFSNVFQDYSRKLVDLEKRETSLNWAWKISLEFSTLVFVNKLQNVWIRQIVLVMSVYLSQDRSFHCFIFKDRSLWGNYWLNYSNKYNIATESYKNFILKNFTIDSQNINNMMSCLIFRWCCLYSS